jgi:hypothetical protein
MLRLIVVLVTAGGLALFLVREIALGIRSGQIRYVDSQRVCSRAESPMLFWFLVALFLAFSTLALYVCLRVLRETVIS